MYVNSYFQFYIGKYRFIKFNINGNVYGGYARVSWMSGTGESVFDSDAFLFLLTGAKPCKFTIKSPEYALTMDATCGPVFGKVVTIIMKDSRITSMISNGV
jgi:hypothetical protein